MPFDGTDPKLATVAMIDALLAFFGEGRTWIAGEMHDGGGNRCLVGAMRHVRATQGIRRDKTAFYLRHAMVREKIAHRQLMAFNDDCETYEQVRALLLSAREIASADIDGRPRPPQPRGLPRPSPAPFHDLTAAIAAFASDADALDAFRAKFDVR